MEGLTEFVTKSFDENSKSVPENLDRKFKQAETPPCSNVSSPSSERKGELSAESPKDLSVVKIDVCSSRPESPCDEGHNYETGMWACLEYFILGLTSGDAECSLVNLLLPTVWIKIKFYNICKLTFDRDLAFRKCGLTL